MFKSIKRFFFPSARERLAKHFINQINQAPVEMLRSFFNDYNKQQEEYNGEKFNALFDLKLKKPKDYKYIFNNACKSIDLISGQFPIIGNDIVIYKIVETMTSITDRYRKETISILRAGRHDISSNWGFSLPNKEIKEYQLLIMGRVNIKDINFFETIRSYAPFSYDPNPKKGVVIEIDRKINIDIAWDSCGNPTIIDKPNKIKKNGI